MSGQVTKITINSTAPESDLNNVQEEDNNNNKDKNLEEYPVTMNHEHEQELESEDMSEDVTITSDSSDSAKNVAVITGKFQRHDSDIIMEGMKKESLTRKWKNRLQRNQTLFGHLLTVLAQYHFYVVKCNGIRILVDVGLNFKSNEIIVVMIFCWHYMLDSNFNWLHDRLI